MAEDAVASVVSPAFATLLRSGRAEFNTRFSEMRRRHPDLDGEMFRDVLRTMVDPVVSSVASLQPNRTSTVVWIAYDAALQLSAQRLAGTGGRYPAITAAWSHLLPAVAHLVADSPHRVIASVSNALYHLSTSPGANAGDWVDRLLHAAPKMETVDHLLRAGQLAAWRCGLAHFRSGALAAGDGLPPQMALRLLGAPSNASWAQVRHGFASNAWWSFEPEKKPSLLRIARTAGGFRGFGGLFSEPPLIAALDGQLFVRSGQECWLLTADQFGATFHRADPADFEHAHKTFGDPRNYGRAEGSSIRHLGETVKLSHLGGITSTATISGTMAVTGRHTHAVTLLAIKG